MTPNPSPPFRPSSHAITKNIGNRLRRLERGDVGLWHYVIDSNPFTGYNKWGIPNSPGSLIPGGTTGNIPPDCAVMETGTGDPDTAFFQNSWTNAPTADGTYHPLAFRLHPASKIQIIGVIGFGILNTTVTTLPQWARPRFNVAGVMSSPDPTVKWAVTLSVNGAFVVVGEV